ncbi:hypothetical protein NQ314_017573 [Rhamnusium bicolor]|uniref:RNA-directed DNA polymerase n=1 Tax=Rhamnusium bicolor TaxID=1586634 RepID=A0AAV8WU60_9CUCU|nr:hypothetical protein NQ314_017573 [Rhamnusium bicolor]
MEDSWYNQLRGKILANPDLYPHFKVENNLIFKHIVNKLPVKTNLSEWKLLVPILQRPEILKQCHDSSTSAHFGFFKTLKRISEDYYWPKMRKDILRYVKSCKVCGSQKVSFSRYGLMGKEKKVEFPWQIISADIFGPVTRSKRGYSYLLVVADWFTKYVLVHPMRSATAQTVSRFMENEVFLVYGVPQFIITDNGKQFASSHFRKLAERYKVQKIWFNAKYHPQVNPVERSNATIGTAIRSYIQDNHQDWDLEIHRVAHAIRTATHEVTGFPPTFLNFGRKVPISGDFYGQVESTEGIQLEPGDRNKYADDVSKLSDLYKTVVDRLHDSYKKNQKTYNLRRREIVYAVGDKVWKKIKYYLMLLKIFQLS